jgi:hypothetical protein
MQGPVYEIVCNMAHRWPFCSRLGTVRNLWKQMCGEEIWYCEMDPAGTGNAAILNLPAVCDIQKGI